MPEVLDQPTTTPEPQVQTPSPVMGDFDKTFADLDESPAPAPEPTPEPSPTPTPETKPAPAKDPESGKFVKPDKAEDKAPTDKPHTPEYEPPQVVKPSELRTWAKRMGGRAQQAETQLSRLNARIKELESKPSESVDVKAITQELANYKKRFEEQEGELKVTRYERSGEYKEKYEKPYQSAVRSAYAEIGELLVNVPNPEDPENPRERQATAQDFDEVYSLPLGPATKLAKQKFGDAASIVIGHVKAIKDARKAAVGAIEEHKGKAVEFEQQQTAQQRMEQEGRSRMFSEAVNAISQKYPTLFAERDGDTTWNQSLSKGRAMADLAFGDRKGLTPVQSAILDAQVHARISAFPGLRQENEKLRADLSKLTKEIEDIRGSGPGKPATSSTKSETGREPTLDEAFDRMVPG